MRNIIRALGALLLAAAALAGPSPPAQAQCNGIFASGTICGNSGASSGVGAPSTFSAALNRAFGATANQTLFNTAGTWGAGVLPAVAGGTGLASGTSGGVPYFNSSTTIASSGALTANLPVIGGGAGAAPTVGTRSGNTTQFVTTTGTLTNGDCVSISAAGNFVAAGGPCTTGGGGGTVTAGTAGQFTYYASTGTTVVGSGLFSQSGSAVTLRSTSPGLFMTGTEVSAKSYLIQEDAGVQYFANVTDNASLWIFQNLNNTRPLILSGAGDATFLNSVSSKQIGAATYVSQYNPVCDNSTDDHTPFQNAANAAIAANGVLVIDKTNCRLASKITVTAPDGAHTSLLVYLPGSNSVTVSTNSAAGGFIKYDGTVGAHLVYCGVVGGYSASYSPGGSDHAAWVIESVGCARTYVHNHTIGLNGFTKMNGIKYHGVFRGLIFNNYIDMGDGAGGGGGIGVQFEQDSNGIQIIGNEIYHSLSHCVLSPDISGGITDGSIANTIIGNYIEQCTDSGGVSGAAIRLGSGAIDTFVNSNYVNNSLATCSIDIVDSGTRTHLNNNTVTGSACTDNIFSNGAGSVVTGNIGAGNTGSGFFLHFDAAGSNAWVDSNTQYDRAANRFISNAGTNVNFGGGNYSSAGAYNVLSASPGYSFLPGGIVMQWGTTGSISANSCTTVTFPVAFANGLLVANLTVNSAQTNDMKAPTYTAGSATTMSVCNNYGSASELVSWTAIGK